MVSSSSVSTIISGAFTVLGNHFSTLLPVVLAALIGFAVFFGILYWIYGRARGI